MLSAHKRSVNTDAMSAKRSVSTDGTFAGEKTVVRRLRNIATIYKTPDVNTSETFSVIDTVGLST